MKHYQFYLELAIRERSFELESIDEGMIQDAIDLLKKSIKGAFKETSETLNDTRKLYALIHKGFKSLNKSKQNEIQTDLNNISQIQDLEKRRKSLIRIQKDLIKQLPPSEHDTALELLFKKYEYERTPDWLEREHGIPA